MTRKQIDAAREARLWIGQVIVPVVTATVTVMAIPEVRNGVVTTCKEVTNNLKDKIKRRKFKVKG